MRGPVGSIPVCARNMRAGRPGVPRVSSTCSTRPSRQGLGDGTARCWDAHRSGPRSRRCSSASGSTEASPRSRGAGQPSTASCCGGSPATRGVSTPSAPTFAAPPGDPSGALAAVEGVAEKHGVVGQVRHQLGRQVVLVVDRLDRAHRLARPAVDALVRLDVQAAAALVDAVDRTLVHAGPIGHVDARLSDHVGHGLEFTQLALVETRRWTAVTTELLDVRPLRKPDKHPTIFGVYDGLGCGESFVLVNNHDPVHLHDEFEIEHAGGYGWEYLERGTARMADPDHEAGLQPAAANAVQHRHGHRDRPRRSQVRPGSSRCGAVTWTRTSSGCLPRAPSRRTRDPTSTCSSTCSAGAGELTTELDTVALRPVPCSGFHVALAASSRPAPTA